ncbi:MAG TPA: RNA polymerase sigma factor [Sedimentisphaerales bacterium]|nr:RNA polymerase sigma factor [Sedimentisphaerales bacterium]
MTEEQTWTELVKLAQQGHGNSVDSLARKAQGRLRAYVYRVTLDYELTEDLSQEVLLQMVKSLDGLNKAESFWPWMYRIAQSKIQQYYKTRRKTALISDSAFSQDFLSYRSDYHDDEGLRQLVHKDLSKKVMSAMKQIRQQYRAVLSLRCFEDLSYSDIALTMQCSEVRARVLFFRAKHALKKELSHQGLSKSLLLMSLGLFGRLTAPADVGTSVVTVTANTTQVGLTAAALATASSRLGIATLTTIAVVLVGVGGMSLRPEKPPLESPITPRADINSMHFTTQLKDNSPEARGSLSKGAYEQWLYFPDGADGPMFMRMQRWDPQQLNKLCAWLEDGQANYYFDSGNNIVHITNCRVCWSNLKVRRLPTDTAEFSEFLSNVEDNVKGLGSYVRDPNTGYLTSFVDYRFNNAPDFQTEYLYNTVGTERFQFDWPADIPIVDDRDPMHKRGWTYFIINGTVGEQEIAGRGCIPFVYNASKEHPAWLNLKIGEELEITDCSRGAYLRQGDQTIAAYQPGTFFKGLARPWMGMHTANIVRRDAAEQQIWFQSEWAQNETDVFVAISHEGQQDSTDLIYTIDMENDLIKTITFDLNGRARGSLIFSYLQDIDQLANQFAEPAISAGSQPPIQQSPGIRWLIYLAQGNLGK